MLNADSLSLYLHIPFCTVRCSYCAFNIFAHAESFIPTYIDAMCNELRWLGKATTQPIHTIYLGGGTPSLLSPNQIATILNQIRREFQVAPDAEISMEINPESISHDFTKKGRINDSPLQDRFSRRGESLTRPPFNPALDYLSQVRELGVNRLSIGMQSAHADELQLFDRQHTLNDVEQTVQMARQSGFQNISLDLI